LVFEIIIFKLFKKYFIITDTIITELITNSHRKIILFAISSLIFFMNTPVIVINIIIKIIIIITFITFVSFFDVNILSRYINEYGIIAPRHTNQFAVFLINPIPVILSVSLLAMCIEP